MGLATRWWSITATRLPSDRALTTHRTQPYCCCGMEGGGYIHNASEKNHTLSPERAPFGALLYCCRAQKTENQRNVSARRDKSFSSPTNSRAQKNIEIIMICYVGKGLEKTETCAETSSHTHQHTNNVRPDMSKQDVNISHIHRREPHNPSGHSFAKMVYKHREHPLTSNHQKGDKRHATHPPVGASSNPHPNPSGRRRQRLPQRSKSLP